MSGWAVREERRGDEAAIRRMTQAAFSGHPYSSGREAAILDRLRVDGDLLLSLVAERESGEIVGHAAFSPVTLSTGDRGWVALGPISVEPAHQGRGIGRSLVEKAVARLRAAGAKGIVLVGDPALYGRFGFEQGTALSIEGPLAAYFQVLAFTAERPPASVTFAPAFWPDADLS